MKSNRWIKQLIIFAAVVGLVVPAVVQAASNVVMYPKISSFVFFVDQSGSMQKTYKPLGKSKISVAKDILLKMNEEIPELNYMGSVQLFAPDEVLLDPTVYNRETFKSVLEKIPTKFPIFGRYTPMAPGMQKLDETLQRLSGDVAVIMFSDGEANRGGDPVAEARAMKEKYGNRLCFHVVSLANKPEGEKVLQEIAQLNNCVYVSAADLQNPEMLKNFVKDIFYDFKPVKREVIILRGINFDFDKYNIKPEAQAILDSGVEILKKHPEIKIVIEGHTDSIGSEAYNQKLSEKRAKAVYDYFVKKGISPDRMKTVGYGETRPKADNSTEEGRAINRRVEIKVVK